MKNKSNSKLVKTTVFTGLALIAFAANSVLCRLALGDMAIDAASFTIVRLLSGTIILRLILMSANHTTNSSRGSWLAGLMLFMYAITFSYAYITLDTATGALILFGAVQITMVLMSLFSGSRLHQSEWMGLSIAFGGFAYLILPELTTPSLDGFLLMTVAGMTWGIYTLKGRGSANAIMDTAYNFFRTIPCIAVLLIFTVKNVHYSTEGIVLAALSGGIASAMGYTLWYIALGGLSAMQAAVVQLSVPVIAALGGVIFVSETFSLRLFVSAVMILGGILLVVLGNNYFLKLSKNQKK